MRGEAKARWFIAKWTGLGGGFVFITNNAGKEEMALRFPPERLVSEDVAILAMFSFAHSYCYRIAAGIVRAERLDEPVSDAKLITA
jgi:hypothetical protein